MKVVVIGGVAGGASTAARLRRLDETIEIVLLERGEFISYANCGLPYYIGGVIEEEEELQVQTKEDFSLRFHVEVKNFHEAIEIHKEEKSILVRNQLTKETTLESYDKLVLAPGAEPVRPPLEGIDDPRVFTLRNIPDTLRIKQFIVDEEPRHGVIIGGGAIGIEMAENLKNAGVETTVVELANHIIGPLDEEMARMVEHHIEAKGVKLLLGQGVSGIKKDGNMLSVQLKDRTIPADFVILSVGVRPESKLARLAGITLNPRGAIVVNEHMQTSDPDIYALGDVVEVVDFITNQKVVIPLAGPANKQGRIVADHIAGIPSSYHGTQGSSILKIFDLTVANTGINERTAKLLGMDYEKSYTFPYSHATYYPGAEKMAIKLLFDRNSGKILGAQVIGTKGVDKRLDVIATAIRAKMGVNDLAELELSYAPPYSSAKDPVNMAGFAAQNILTGKTKIFHYHDVDSLDMNQISFVDTRTEEEFNDGSIKNAVNIPLDALRDRLNQLDPSKPVYLFCQVGIRGYIATRILMQHGFTAYNLSGGFELYNSYYDLTCPNCETLF